MDEVYYGKHCAAGHFVGMTGREHKHLQVAFPSEERKSRRFRACAR